jgi:choline transport protein
LAPFFIFSGTVFLIVILFCMVDPITILNTDTGMPITELMYQATHSRAAATVMTLMLAVCFINGTMGCITSASRLTWAMARDKGIVFPE